MSSRGQRPQRQGDGGRWHQEQGDDHGDGHMHDHVPREHDPAIDARGTAHGIDEERPAEHPEQGLPHRPAVTAAAQPQHPTDIQAHGEQGHGDPQPVGVPDVQPGIGRRRAGVRVAGQLIHRRRVRGEQPGRRRRSARQRHRGAHREAHKNELADGKPGKGRGIAGAGIQPLDHGATVPPSRDAERDQGPGLDHEQGAVAAAQIAQARHAEPRDQDPTENDSGIRPGGHRREPPDRDGQVGLQLGPQDQDREQPADPCRDR